MSNHPRKEKKKKKKEKEREGEHSRNRLFFDTFRLCDKKTLLQVFCHDDEVCVTKD